MISKLRYQLPRHKIASMTFASLILLGLSVSVVETAHARPTEIPADGLKNGTDPTNSNENFLWKTLVLMRIQDTKSYPAWAGYTIDPTIGVQLAAVPGTKGNQVEISVRVIGSDMAGPPEQYALRTKFNVITKLGDMGNNTTYILQKVASPELPLPALSLLSTGLSGAIFSLRKRRRLQHFVGNC